MKKLAQFALGGLALVVVASEFTTDVCKTTWEHPLIGFAFSLGMWVLVVYLTVSLMRDILE